MLAIYTRLSKEDEESNSIKNQLREGEAYAKLNRIPKEKIEIYNEGEGLSGTKRVNERPELKRMIEDVENGKISSVWMRKQERLARLGITVMFFADAIVKNNIKLHFGDRGDVDLTDPIQMFNLTIMAGVDALKPAQQSKATKRALHDNFREGRVWGIIPYGYKSDDNMMPFIAKDEAKIVKRIFKYFLSGKSAHRIANKLNEDNVPTKYNGFKGASKTVNKYSKVVTQKDNTSIEWAEKTVRGMLENTWYNGTRTYAGMKGDVPRIINELLFNKVQQAIKNRKGIRTSTPKYNYLLKGLIKCNACGRNYYGRFRPDKSDNFYMCSSYRKVSTKCGNKGINIPKLESFIIKHLFKSKDLLKMMESISNDNESVTSIEKEMSVLESIQSKTNSTVFKYAKLLGDELQDDELILQLYENAKQQLEDIKYKLIKLRAEHTDLVNFEALNNYKKELQSVDSKSDFRTIKTAVNNIIESITIKSLLHKNGRIEYVIWIHYKGLNETSEFYTEQPYFEWMHGLTFYNDKDDLESPFETMILNKEDMVYFN